jgi:hypothetical protein
MLYTEADILLSNVNDIQYLTTAKRSGRPAALVLTPASTIRDLLRVNGFPFASWE